jgi:riboflavin synthase
MVMADLRPGGSICVNGACLTVAARDDSTFSVDVVPETLRRTNLGSLVAGDPVNLERPVPAAGRLDGHIVQGHVDGTGVIESVEREQEALLITVKAPPALMRYIVEKGYIAVDGASLTIVDCSREMFTVTIIPYTRNNTLFGSRRVRDRVNLEVDVIAKYVERLTSWRRPPPEDELQA